MNIFLVFPDIFWWVLYIYINSIEQCFKIYIYIGQIYFDLEYINY